MGVPPDAASYILIRPEPGVETDTLAARLRAALPETNLVTQADFIASDREMIRQMGADILRAMNAVAYVVGLLVIALTIYTATLERAREYGMLKAIGADTFALLRVVLAQAFLGSVLGLAVGTGLAYGIAALVSRLLPEMLVLIEPETLVRQVPVFLAVTGLAAVIPIGRLARMDPLVVFKG
jgi:putative ABC transport system permease protein